MADGIRTQFYLDGDTVAVNRVQDVEPTLEWANEQRKLPNPKGEKFWPKWELPPVIQEQLYIKYSQGRFPAPPMDVEFWQWVDKKVMTDPDYSKFRLANTSNPFFLGYRDPAK